MPSSSTPNSNQFSPINPAVLSAEYLSSPLPAGTNSGWSSRTLSSDMNTKSFNSCNTSPSFTTGNTTPTPSLSDAAKTVASGIEITQQGEEEENKPSTSNAKGGREKGATAYSAEEHVALLTSMAMVRGSFNVSESSPLWTSVYNQMCQDYYSTTSERLSSTLHGHFVDMYSSFKLRIRNLLLWDKSKKCPNTFEKGDDAADEYVVSLFNILTSGSKKYKSKKWWRLDVVELLLKLHLDYVADFGSEKQSATWIAEKAVEHRNKFARDQRNREAELACKRAAEEEECKETAKQRKAVAESSVEMVSVFRQLVEAPRTNNVDEKIASLRTDMSAMKTDIMDEIGQKMETRDRELKDEMETRNREMKDMLSSILDVVRGLADKNK